jgi:hypothetical protein
MMEFLKSLKLLPRILCCKTGAIMHSGQQRESQRL